MFKVLLNKIINIFTIKDTKHEIVYYHRLTPEVLDNIQARINHVQCTDKTTESYLAYTLGQQSVMNILRKDFSV